MTCLSRYLKIYPSQDKPDHFLLFSTLRGATVVVPGVILEAARSGALTDQEEATLKRLGILVDDPTLEREQMRTMLTRANGQNRPIRATAILNLDCNLNCGYCYEGKFRHEQYMSTETAQLLVDFLIRQYISKGREVIMTFYGGEALLSEDLIRLISLPLQDAAKANNIPYSFTLVTNGTLLNREMAERLVALGLTAAKITLDGPKEIHDRQRPYVSGSGSFDAIVQNIADINDIVQVQIGGNFYEENYKEYPRMLDHLIERGITPDKLYRVQFTPVTPQAGCADHNSGCASSSAPWLIEAAAFLREEILRRGFRTPKPEPSACMVELDYNFVVNYDGTIFKCPAFMGWDGLSIGSLADGIADYTTSHCIGNWQNDECLDCAYLPLCFGGCRFLNLLQGKALGDVDCRKEYLDNILERLILQDIAHPTTRPAQAAQPAR